mgnify:FL=1
MSKELPGLSTPAGNLSDAKRALPFVSDDISFLCNSNDIKVKELKTLITKQIFSTREFIKTYNVKKNISEEVLTATLSHDIELALRDLDTIRRLLTKGKGSSKYIESLLKEKQFYRFTSILVMLRTIYEAIYSVILGDYTNRKEIFGLLFVKLRSWTDVEEVISSKI